MDPPSVGNTPERLPNATLVLFKRSITPPPKRLITPLGTVLRKRSELTSTLNNSLIITGAITFTSGTSVETIIFGE